MRYVFGFQSSQYPPEPYTSISQGSHEDNARAESSAGSSKAKGKEVDPRERVGSAKGESQSDAVRVCFPFSNDFPEPYILISQHAHEDADRAEPSASLAKVISAKGKEVDPKERGAKTLVADESPSDKVREMRAQPGKGSVNWLS
jgi:hypothetical protein